MVTKLEPTNTQAGNWIYIELTKLQYCYNKMQSMLVEKTKLTTISHKWFHDIQDIQGFKVVQTYSV